MTTEIYKSSKVFSEINFIYFLKFFDGAHNEVFYKIFAYHIHSFLPINFSCKFWLKTTMIIIVKAFNHYINCYYITAKFYL